MLPILLIVLLLSIQNATSEVVAGELNVLGQRCNKTAQCSSTCGKIIYCEGEYIVNDGVNCPVSHPYCVQDVVADYCSDKVELARSDCKEEPKKVEFFCTSEGYFPDPKNCSHYILCAEDIDGNLNPVAYQCPSNQYKYNYRNNRECGWYGYSVPASNCPVITCDSSEAYARVFPGQSQFYYFCIYNVMAARLDPILFKCDNGWTFNGQNCRLDCGSVRNIAIPGNSTGYYACTGSSSYTIQNCPHGYNFNAGLGYCVAVL